MCRQFCDGARGNETGCPFRPAHLSLSMPGPEMLKRRKPDPPTAGEERGGGGGRRGGADGMGWDRGGHCAFVVDTEADGQDETGFVSDLQAHTGECGPRPPETERKSSLPEASLKRSTHCTSNRLGLTKKP